MPTLTRAKPWETTTTLGIALIAFPIGGFLALKATASAWYGLVLYPLPLATALPFILLDGPSNLAYVSCLFPTAFFWVWGIHLFRGTAKIPVRSEALFWLLATLTVFYFALSWQYGVRWQGYFHLVAVAVLNLISIILLWTLLAYAKAKPSFKRNVAFHWALVAWLVWLAFPWLGEGF